MKEVYIIVDPVSTGAKYLPCLQGRGIENIVCIQSSKKLPKELQPKRMEGARYLVYDGNIENLLKEFEDCRVKLCFPGYESGVELADIITERLGLPTNGTKYSEARRNKYLMVETVSQAGLKTVKHFKSRESKEILGWIKREEKYPVVLKPLASASSDGVHFCHSESDVAKAVDAILNTKDKFGEENTEALVEGYNPGQEYIVNTVSWAGQHYIAEVYRVYKIKDTSIYERAEIVTSAESEFKTVTEYTQKVLDALHIQYGAGYTELKYTPEGGAVLIETAARIMGDAPVGFTQSLLGFSQLSLLMEAYLHPSGFLKMVQTSPTAQQKTGLALFMMSDVSGILRQEIDISAITKLPCFHSTDCVLKPGDSLSKTVNARTIPGILYFIGTKEELREVSQRFRNMESDGLYRRAVRSLASASTTVLMFSTVFVFFAIGIIRSRGRDAGIDSNFTPKLR